MDNVLVSGSEREHKIIFWNIQTGNRLRVINTRPYSGGLVQMTWLNEDTFAAISNDIITMWNKNGSHKKTIYPGNKVTNITTLLYR
jgi:WD40 repeat protein